MVSLGTNQAPTVSPTAVPNSGAAPLPVQFAANAADPDGDELAFFWDFGDGGTSTLADPQHTYTTAGVFGASVVVSDGELEASGMLTIAVDSSLSVTVNSVRVHFKHHRQTRGAVRLQASYSGVVPGPDDVIEARFDGILLFSAPFSAFELAADDDEVDEDETNPLLYKLREGAVRVKLDLGAGTIRINARELDLSTLDNANGVDLEFSIGAATAVDHIVLESQNDLISIFHAESF
jgi:PKD repeat protein